VPCMFYKLISEEVDPDVIGDKDAIRH
jgi:hypothetical protein